MINYFYNIILNDDKCDLYSDVLTSVRKDYYLSREKQKGKITQDSSGNTLFYEFSLEKDKPLKWSLSDSENLLSDTANIEDGKYCVNFYNDKGLYKTLTFSKFHTLLKLEYYDMSISSIPYCVIEPRKANNELCLLMTKKSSYGGLALFAMPEIDDEFVLDKINGEFTEYSVVASTNAGVVKFLSEEQLELFNVFVEQALALKAQQQAPVSYIEEADAVLASKLNPKDFNVKRNLSQAVDITDAEFFSYDISEEYLKDFDDASISEYDTKPEQSTSAETLDVDATLESFLNEAADKQVVFGHLSDYEDDSFDDNVQDSDYKQGCYEQSPDAVIDSANSKYLYYGDVDENGKRTGFGRTTTENNKTAYEGHYLSDRRNGYGAYYYKDGTLCYFGEWSENKRNGVGVGISSFDKTIHVGKFTDNKPVDDGVRIENNGNIKFVKKLLSNGFTVVLEFDNDELIIKKYNSDGEIVSENTNDLKYF